MKTPSHVTLSGRERSTVLKLFTDDIGTLILKGLAVELGGETHNYGKMVQMMVPTRDDEDAVLVMNIPSDVAVSFKNSWWGVDG